MRKKRVVIMSDLHCGHVVGLTPKTWQLNHKEEVDSNWSKWNKWVGIQEELWAHYTKIMKELQPIDVLIVNGDCIDGKGQRSGGTELICSDRNEQVDMAVEAIKVAKARKIIMTYGTSYHAGVEDDWEATVAQKTGAKVGSHEWADVNGLIFDVKHHVGGSAIPHGRHTAIARDKLWNGIWAEHKEQPQSDILIRSHVHYFSYAGGDNWLGITTPALQGMGSKYGARRMSGHVNWGMLSFDVKSREDWAWVSHLRRLDSQVASPVKL